MQKAIRDETLAIFRRPCSLRQASMMLGIAKQNVMKRLQTLEALGAKFQKSQSRIYTKGPPSTLWKLVKEPPHK